MNLLNHPIHHATEWRRPILDGLPDEVLRWFAGDVAIRSSWDEGVGYNARWRAIETSRLYALGEATEEDLNIARRNLSETSIREATSPAFYSALIDAKDAAERAADAAARDAGRRASQAEGRYLPYGQYIHQRKREAWIEADAVERDWQIERLRYLTMLWAIAGQRGLILLYEGTEIPF